MDNEMMIGDRRPVLVRAGDELFGGIIIGQWHDTKSAVSGPVVRTPKGAEIDVDWKRIVRFTDTDEIPWFKEEEVCLD